MLTIECLIKKHHTDLDQLPVIIDKESELSYEDLLKSVWTTAKYLKDQGITPQTTVGILAPNSIDYLITLLALWHIKAVTCPLSPRLPIQSIQSSLLDVNAKFLLTSVHEILDSPAITAKKIYLFEGTQNPSLHFESDDNQNLYFPFNQNLTIIYTSGSSADPKAALHSFGNHYFSALGSNEHIPFETNDRWLLSLPLYHVGGLSILFRTLLARATVVVPNSDQDIFQQITSQKISHISVVPTQLARLLENDKAIESLKNLKAILVGGSAAPASLINKAIEHNLPIYLTYGSTEMASQIATTGLVQNADQSTNAKILNYRQLKIDENNEICVKGEALFKGYLNDSKTALPIDQEGWFHSGDIGQLSEDNCLTVTGRKDNMFISAGENIQPEEIEKTLLSLKGIEQAIVVPGSDQEYGQRPVAFVKLDAQAKLTQSQICSILESSLPKFKIPDAFFSWQNDWEITDMKISRQRLTQLVENKNPNLIQIPQ